MTSMPLSFKAEMKWPNIRKGAFDYFIWNRNTQNNRSNDQLFQLWKKWKYVRDLKIIYAISLYGYE